jgi:hypothetical protein
MDLLKGSSPLLLALQTSFIHCIYHNTYPYHQSLPMSILISVPAGRCFRRAPDSKWVDPQPAPGLIEMKYEDDLMHLCESVFH